jgi:hypothetical protein
MIVSTRHPENLCEPGTLLRRCVSLAVLDAILSPDWESRYYSFDGAWGEDTLMASMRSGSGDDIFLAFGPGGVFIKGFAHEAPMAPASRRGEIWPGIYDGLPASFDEFRNEPAFSTEAVTFCFWWDATAPGWRVGVRELPEGDDPDGSSALLAIYDGDPKRYVEWASDYYETDVPLDTVRAIYDQKPLTRKLVARLNADADVEDVLRESEDWPYGEPT